MNGRPDSSLDALLSLDGEVFFIDPAGNHWVKFEVKRTEVTDAQPHGLRYSFTLHDRQGERLVGFDNAHPVASSAGPAAKRAMRVSAFDHKHRLRSIRPYDYADAASLLADFWNEVEAVLAERGVEL